MSTSATQQFDGNTIEEALGAAVASMGDDLEIVDAQRVRRRRRLGVRREERFEVIAAPRSSPAEFEDVLRRMVDRVDDRERAHEVDLRGGRADATVDLRAPRGGVDLADSDLSWWEDAEFVVPEPSVRAPMAEVEHRELEIDVRTPRTALDDELFGPETGPGSDAETTPYPAAPASPAQDAAVFESTMVRMQTMSRPADVPDREEMPAPVVTIGGATGWSLEALADLGLAPLVLERVAARNPRADLDWVAALAGAIEDIAAAIDPHGSNVELTGHGRHAAVDLIGGLCRGMRVGHLVIDGVRIEATPVELALGVRACLQA
ncbi:MAG: hypothetical protein ACE367_16690 [Acidimicrobiales bacterium]